MSGIAYLHDNNLVHGDIKAVSLTTHTGTATNLRLLSG